MLENLIINDKDNYLKLVEYYEKNNKKIWSEWLEVDTIFSRTGKQGIVGLMRLKENPDIKFIFKLSQYINYLSYHEIVVMEGLNKLNSYCPHFSKCVGGILCNTEPSIKNKGNPFDVISKYPIEKEVILSEYINNSIKLYNFIKSNQCTHDVIFSIIKQVLMAICVSQNKKKFTHYDLHSNNIMLKKCNKNLVFLYVLDDNTQFCIPTNGNYPIIIDYGFSYIEEMDGGPLWPSMGHTEAGFYSNQYNNFSDAKLFLITFSSELHQIKKTKETKKLQNIVKNIYSNLKVDWDSGWDINKKSASDYIYDSIKDYTQHSNLFNDYTFYCLDLVQSLIILPLEKQDYSNITIYFKTFLNEFVKIEKELGNNFYNLYILKNIVDVTRDVQQFYSNKQTRGNSILSFKKHILETLDKVSSFCSPKNLNYEKMLCSLLCFARASEGILYNHMSRVNIKNEKSYKKLPLQSTEQIYGVIDINIPDKYVFNEKTKVVVLNSIEEKYDILKLEPKQIDEINKYHSINRGQYLYNIYKKI
jgi:hypothetical protein